jgi:hypothetical protein
VEILFLLIVLFVLGSWFYVLFYNLRRIFAPVFRRIFKINKPARNRLNLAERIMGYFTFPREGEGDFNTQFNQQKDQSEWDDHDQQQWAMDESIKSITPFEQGGYNLDQGNSFNEPHHHDPFNGF